MTQQLFDEMIGNPPPSTVDVDGIVRRKTGQRRLRRAALGVTAMVAVLAVVGVAALLPHGDRPGPGVADRPSGSAAPSGGVDSRPDPSAFFEESMRNWLPQRLRWLDLPPKIVPPSDGGVPSTARARVDVAGRQGTVVVTVWPRGVDAADGCDGLQQCLPLSEPGEIPSCGWIRDVAVRPELGLTRPGWEVRCVKVGGRAVSIMVTNQTGAPTDPLPQAELPVHLADVLPIIAVLVEYVQ
ncbi:hypothetical protein AB0K00_26490 [Dactylosporangium sp. NPDC049525]|uniref:hypothetical protein n=1 Tax=Dactylosporangium sp. NPDC049525 TaxID=3154730 RepID=UPI003446891B